MVRLTDKSTLIEKYINTSYDVVKAVYDNLASIIKISGLSNFSILTAITDAFLIADRTKLDNIESGATADQTDAEIRVAIEAATDSNAFTDTDHSKLGSIESGATTDQTDAEIRAAIEAATDSNVFTDADHSKLGSIEDGATVDQSAAEIETVVSHDNLQDFVGDEHINWAVTGAEQVHTDRYTSGGGGGSPVAGHVQFTEQQIVDGSTYITLLNMNAFSESVWRTIGATGSGASTIWTALDDVPNDAKGVIFDIDVISTNALLNWIKVYHRAPSAGHGPNPTNSLFVETVGIIASDARKSRVIALFETDSIELRYQIDGGLTATIDLYYKGFVR